MQHLIFWNILFPHTSIRSCGQITRTRGASLNKSRVDANNEAFKRPTTVDASAVRQRLRRSLAAALTDHRLETTSSARWLVQRCCVDSEFDRLISGRGFLKGDPVNGTLSAPREGEGSEWPQKNWWCCVANLKRSAKWPAYMTTYNHQLLTFSGMNSISSLLREKSWSKVLAACFQFCKFQNMHECAGNVDICCTSFFLSSHLFLLIK